MKAAVAHDKSFVELHADIGRYYTAKALKYGATPLGVDWTCMPTQELRFVQLLKICDFRGPFSLNDVGCGYGALFAFLTKRHRRTSIDYLGIDLAPAMIEEAKRLWQHRRQAKFVVGSSSPRIADYSVASGIFNVKLNQPLDLWTEFVKELLTDLHTNSRLGFAVNFLTPLAQGIAEQEELYRVQPEVWTNYCTQKFGARTQLVSNYGLREFTLLVRR